MNVAEGSGQQPEPLPDQHPDPARAKRRQRRFGHARAMLLSVLTTVAFIGLIVAGVVFSVMALTGKTLTLPLWAVNGVEAQIRPSLPPGVDIDMRVVEVLVDDGWVPRLRVQDLRLIGAGGGTLVMLPDTRVVFDAAAFATGQLRPATLRIAGAEVALRRDREGQFNLDFGAGAFAQVDSFAALLDLVEGAFGVPALERLQSITVSALTLTLADELTGQVWHVGDGRLALINGHDSLSAELGLSLTGDPPAGDAQAGDMPAGEVRAGDGQAGDGQAGDGQAGDGQAGDVQLRFTTSKADPSARITATISGITASDLAAQVPPLGFLQALDAPLSGTLTTALDPAGQISVLQGALQIGAGAIAPNTQTAPFPFENASIALDYAPAASRLNITQLTVRSKTAAFDATGHVLLQDGQGRALTGGLQGTLPASFVAQLALKDLRVDPAGEFATPVTFATGALDMRLRLNPFRVDLGQLSLVEGDQHLRASGWAAGQADGWHLGLDVALDAIAADRLVALWPLRLVPRTREWLAANVQGGMLSRVNGAVRLTPGADARLQLGYEFRDAEVRFLRTLPPITNGAGYAALEGKRYVIVLDQGTVTAPLGGDINVAGSVFEIDDITQRPNIAQIALTSQSSVTAALSLLDLPPFGFMTKADRPVDLGEGQAHVMTQLTIPLGARVQLADVDYTVAGTITDFSTTKLVPGRLVAAEKLDMTATPAGMQIAGPGRLGQLPFDMIYSQGFQSADRGLSRVAGTVTLSDDALDDLGVDLPDGFLRGQGSAEVTLNLRRGAPARLTLQSRLAGIGLAVPELGWSKPRDALGSLTVEATLSTPPRVTALALDATGLRATGEITLRTGGGLREALFSRLSVGDWFDAAVTLTGQGRGRAAVAVTDGTIDLRQIPDRDTGDGGEGSPFTLRLDRLIVADSIAFTGFRGEFSPRGGLNGSFTAGVNGEGSVQGTVVPSANGSAVRIQSDDAGAVMAAAGVFSSARGGALDLQLTPRAQDGVFDGRAELSRLRVRNASALAELLNAISVVGLLEQLNGTGIVFNNAELDFVLTPRAIEMTKGSAIGASLGVSMAGVYQTANRQLNVQGVISPIYLVNGVGAVLTRRGEGLFGFNYRMTGTADDPQVSVNPLSILTPGMFRDLFRRPPPVLGDTE